MPIVPGDSISTFRRFYAHYVVARAGVRNDRVREAFATVQREQFAGPGPWQIAVPGGYICTESDDPRLLYQDILLGLAPERGINNGEPSLHAKCVEEAAPRDGDVVVHAGAGTGYYTAILAHMVGTRGRVYAYEIDRDIAGRARTNLRHLPHVTVHAGTAVTTLPKADVVYVNAGATHPPDEWLDALAVGGRMVLPLVPDDQLGCMILITRVVDSAREYAARIFSPAGFIPCLDARDERSSIALKAALSAGGGNRVRSLRRETEPDETAWCIGNGWWLSTAGISGDS